jgi:hypothetical protein
MFLCLNLLCPLCFSAPFFFLCLRIYSENYSMYSVCSLPLFLLCSSLPSSFPISFSFSLSPGSWNRAGFVHGREVLYYLAMHTPSLVSLFGFLVVCLAWFHWFFEIYSPGWSGTWTPLASASQVLGLWVCTSLSCSFFGIIFKLLCPLYPVYVIRLFSVIITATDFRHWHLLLM